MAGDQVLTPIEVFTRDSRCVGLLATRGYRISDVLNDSGTEMVELRDTLTTIAGVSSGGIHSDGLTVHKSNVLLVTPKGEYEAPTRRSRRYVAKPRHGAMIVMPGHILSGIAHLPRRATPLMLLDRNSSLPRFLGITDVTVHGSVHDLGSRHFDVVILQRPAIESVQLTADPLTAERAGTGEVSQGTAFPW